MGDPPSGPGERSRFASADRERELKVLRSLFGDRRGAVGAYLAVMSFVLVGIGALAVDLGRLYTLETELQKVADARCIAAAAELDGEFDALTRATAAAQRLSSGTPGAIVENTQLFATGGDEVDTVNVRFFHTLPPDDLTLDDPQVQPCCEDGVDFLNAIYVAVYVETKTLDNYLIRILGGPDSTNLNAVTVCGVEEVVCDVPAMMICNPAEPGAPTANPNFFDEPGRTLVAKRKGSGGSFWKPGEYGLLDTPTGCTGTDCIREYLARVQPADPICISSRVNIRPGVADAVRQGLNVRFGKYEGPMKNLNKYRGNADFRPGKNVVKGWKKKGSPCDFEEPTGDEAMGLPRDNNLKGVGQRFGNGKWDFAKYWQVNHPNDPVPAELSVAPNPTRHQVYQWEIGSGLIPDGTGHYKNPPGTVEDGKTNVAGPGNDCYQGPNACFSPYDPGCSAADADFLDRRELVIAVIDCEAQGLNGNEDNVRVAEWYRMFMTEPVGDASSGGGPQTDVVLETIAPLDDERFLHREVLIYRDYLEVE
jgi:Flp pilus assembly protein TadG